MTEDVFLLVEDDENDAFLFQRVFATLSKPYRLEIVGDGDEAISYIQGKGPFSDRERYPFPTIVLLDSKLPGKSGAEVLDWIKSNPIDLPLFVATLSGDSQRAAPAKTIERFGKAAIFNCHFLKPATQNNIETLLMFFQSMRQKQAS